MANVFTAGPSRALFFYAQQLIGLGKTLSDTTFNATITSEEIRGGQGNFLIGKYFHDSGVTVDITDVCFNLNYVAASLGVDVQQGGLSLYESSKSGETVAAGGVITLTNTAVAFDGTILAWYKKPSDDDWTVATVTNNKITIPGASTGDSYCVKYFYQNLNAKSITIKSQYVPKTLHLVLINDLFSGETANIASASKYGRLITDIPQFQLSGEQNLAWSATSAATVSLSGSALAVDEGASCEEDSIYGTMTQEIFGSKWQDEVQAIAVGNADLDMITSGKEVLQVYAVFGGNTASRLMDNSYFTFAVESGSAATVDATGTVTASSAGSAVISVTLKEATDKVGYANVTVS